MKRHPRIRQIIQMSMCSYLNILVVHENPSVGRQQVLIQCVRLSKHSRMEQNRAGPAISQTRISTLSMSAPLLTERRACRLEELRALLLRIPIRSHFRLLPRRNPVLGEKFGLLCRPNVRRSSTTRIGRIGRIGEIGRSGNKLARPAIHRVHRHRRKLRRVNRLTTIRQFRRHHLRRMLVLLPGLLFPLIPLPIAVSSKFATILCSVLAKRSLLDMAPNVRKGLLLHFGVRLA